MRNTPWVRMPTAGGMSAGVSAVIALAASVAGRAARRGLSECGRQARGGQHNTPLTQPTRECLAGTREPAGERPLRNAQLPRGLLPRLLFQLAEDHRHAQVLGEPGDLLVEYGRHVRDLARVGRLACETSGRVSTRASRRRRRSLTVRALSAVRYATPYSHAESAARGRTVPAFAASTTNTAWNASSARW